MKLVDNAKNLMRHARVSFMAEVVEIGGGLIVLSILVGTIALPLIYQVNTSTWGATNILVWGVVATVALAAIIMGLISYFRKTGRAD